MYKGIGILFKARDNINKNCLSNLYHTYIFPLLIYCIEVCGNASHCYLLPLFLTPKKIIRLIIFSKHLAHTKPVFKSLNILPLNSLYYHRIGLLMYKLFNGLLPEALNELYIKKGIKYTIIKLEIVINIIFKQVLTVFQRLVLAFSTHIHC